MPNVGPIAQHECPLCGGPNHCAAAASGQFDTPCWCRDQAFPPELLARVPPAERMRSCICAQCVRAAGPDNPKKKAC